MKLSQLKAITAAIDLTHLGQDPDVCFVHPEMNVSVPVESVYTETVNIDGVPTVQLMLDCRTTEYRQEEQRRCAEQSKAKPSFTVYKTLAQRDAEWTESWLALGAVSDTAWKTFKQSLVSDLANAFCDAPLNAQTRSRMDDFIARRFQSSKELGISLTPVWGLSVVGARIGIAHSAEGKAHLQWITEFAPKPQFKHDSRSSFTDVPDQPLGLVAGCTDIYLRMDDRPKLLLRFGDNLSEYLTYDLNCGPGDNPELAGVRAAYERGLSSLRQLGIIT